VRTDDRAGTVALHLSRPDPNILLALGVRFYARRRLARGPIPGTGPYRVAGFVPGS
jgi:hypothetical protein